MATTSMKNVSGVDLEVVVLNNQVVKAGETVTVPTHYPWHTEEAPAEILWPEANWEPAIAAPPADNTDEETD